MKEITYEMLVGQSDDTLRLLVPLYGGDPNGMSREQMEDFLVKTSHEKAGKPVPPRPVASTASPAAFVDTGWPDGADRWVAEHLPPDEQRIAYTIMKHWKPADCIKIFGAAFLTAVLTAKIDQPDQKQGQQQGQQQAQNTGKSLWDRAMEEAAKHGWKPF